MWFRSIYLKTLRDFRIAMLGWGVGMGILIYVVLATFPSLVETPQARASLVSLSGTFAWLAEPIAVDTSGGYATFKIGFLILLIVIWPLLASSRLLRGEEERGSLDALLSLPRGRSRVALEKLAVVWTALLAMCLLIGLLKSGFNMALHVVERLVGQQIAQATAQAIDFQTFLAHAYGEALCQHIATCRKQ
jgi:ABC-2 type transport system permease protein